MFEKLHTPEEAYEYKLGAALKMENTVLEMLEANLKEAHDEQVQSMIRHHQEETRRHVEHLEQAFGMLEKAVDDSPCPAIEGLQKEGKATVKMADEHLVDTVMLGGMAETEHHEIAVYEGLIMKAKLMGREDVADILQKNLADEQATLKKVQSALEQLSRAEIAQAA